MLVCGAGPRGLVDGGTERTVRNREEVERCKTQVSGGGAQSIGSQGRGLEQSQSCPWWTALSRCFTRSSRARPSMALCSARVEPGIGWERQDHRDLGTRVLMKFLRSAFEGPESHQCRTMGLKRGPQEETYAWTCWSNALQKARQDMGRKDGAVRTWNSGSREAYCSTGTRAHCSTRTPV